MSSQQILILILILIAMILSIGFAAIRDIRKMEADPNFMKLSIKYALISLIVTILIIAITVLKLSYR